MLRLYKVNPSKILKKKLIKFKGLNPTFFNPYIPDLLAKGLPQPQPLIALKTEELKNVFTYIELNNFRGFRHSLLLPVRGQRTKTNKKTCKTRSLVLEPEKYNKPKKVRANSSKKKQLPSK